MGGYRDDAAHFVISRLNRRQDEPADSLDALLAEVGRRLSCRSESMALATQSACSQVCYHVRPASTKAEPRITSHADPRPYGLGLSLEEAGSSRFCAREYRPYANTSVSVGEIEAATCVREINPIVGLIA